MEGGAPCRCTAANDVKEERNSIKCTFKGRAGHYDTVCTFNLLYSEPVTSKDQMKRKPVKAICHRDTELKELALIDKRVFFCDISVKKPHLKCTAVDSKLHEGTLEMTFPLPSSQDQQ